MINRILCPLESLPKRITRGELAERMFEGETYDMALPQQWVNHVLEHLPEARSPEWGSFYFGFVWLYDEQAKHCGRPAPLFREAREMLDKYNEIAGTLF
jgi:hypothetical protein